MTTHAARVAETVGRAESGGPSNGARTTGLSLERPFQGRRDYVDWAGGVTVGLGVMILALVVVTMLFRRHLARPRLNFLHFLGLCSLPIFMLFFGSFAIFEGAKRVGFCDSCHSAMHLYVEDMLSGRSETLAAVHYKNRYIREEECYQCHVDYWAFGPVTAKLTGLKHLYYWVIHTPRAMGKEPVKLSGGYDNGLCLRCHAGSEKFLTAGEGVHRDLEHDLVSEDPVSGEPMESCLDCHGPAHPTLSDQKRAGPGATQ